MAAAKSPLMGPPIEQKKETAGEEFEDAEEVEGEKEGEYGEKLGRA